MTYMKPFDQAMVLLDLCLQLLPVDIQHLLGISSFTFVVHDYVAHSLVLYDG